MTLKSRLLAAALAISLSTPAAAATFTFDFPALSGPSSRFASTSETFLFQGPTPGVGGISYGTVWERPPALDLGVWEYSVMPKILNFSIDRGDFLSMSVFGQCSFDSVGCPEFSPPVPPLVGDIIRFDLLWYSDGLYTGLRPQFALRFTVPDGVEISHMPLPAAWVMLASMLGLGGLFRWARRRVVAP